MKPLPAVGEVLAAFYRRGLYCKPSSVEALLGLLLGAPYGEIVERAGISSSTLAKLRAIAEEEFGLKPSGRGPRAKASGKRVVISVGFSSDEFALLGRLKAKRGSRLTTILRALIVESAALELKEPLPEAEVRLPDSIGEEGWAEIKRIAGGLQAPGSKPGKAPEAARPAPPPNPPEQAPAAPRPVSVPRDLPTESAAEPRPTGPAPKVDRRKLLSDRFRARLAS